MQKTTGRDTNRNFAKHDQQFQEACRLANVQPTKRQASKWFQGRGRAYAQRQNTALKDQ